MNLCSLQVKNRSEKAHSANQSWMRQRHILSLDAPKTHAPHSAKSRTGSNLILYAMMLSKLCQILIDILIEMLLKYNGKQGYIHKVLKKVGVYSQG